MDDDDEDEPVTSTTKRSSRPTKLDPLVLTELSLVDRGANRDAKVTIFKRDDPDDEPDLVATLEAEVADLEAQVEHLTKLAARQDTVHHRSAPEEESVDFHDHVESIRKSENCSRTAAAEKARARFPAAFQRYQSGGPRSDFDELVEAEIAKGCNRVVAGQRVMQMYGTNPDAATVLKRSRSEGAFMEMVEKHRAEFGGSRTAAMEVVRRRHPDAFAAYQED